MPQCLFKASQKPPDRFEAIGCGTFGDHLIQDQIFGHYKGAFSGAFRDQEGELEICDNGALFLDDLDAASDPLKLQGALLRFLSSDGQVRRLGFNRCSSPQCKQVSTWFICSTNQDPKHMIRTGLMRMDFPNRFFQFILVPPLNERPEDIPFIAKSIWSGMRPSGTRSLDIPALKWLRDRRSKWVGNAGEITSLLVCALDLITDRPQTSLINAFEKVTTRGEDHLAWYYGDSRDTGYRHWINICPDTSDSMAGHQAIRSTGKSKTSPGMRQEEERLRGLLDKQLTEEGRKAMEAFCEKNSKTSQTRPPSRSTALS